MNIGVLTIRADSTSVIGTGHVMRMIALGQAWQERGGDVRFIGHVGQLKARIIKERFDLIETDAFSSNQQDLHVLRDNTVPNTWIAVDGYQFDSDYQQSLRRMGYRTLIMDDTCDRKHYFADILLNQNSNAAEYDYALNDDASLLLGVRFTLLRREFLASKSRKHIPPKSAQNILITMGGADPSNTTALVLKLINTIASYDYNIKVVAGAATPHLDAINNAANHLRCNYEVLTNVNDMSPIMNWADLAISASGSTCWELLFFGIPTIAIQTADNQRGIFSELRRTCTALCLEASTLETNFAHQFESMVHDSKKRQSMSRKGSALIDGKGAFRVADTIYCKSITLRPARESDCSILFEWRNDPTVRQRSFSTDEITLDDHQEWFRQTMTDDSSHLFIAQDACGLCVGQIRFDITDNEAYVSISVAPSMTGRGIGSTMLRQAISWLNKNKQRHTAIALIKPNNLGSITMFRKVGFEEARLNNDAADGHLRFEYKTKR